MNTALWVLLDLTIVICATLCLMSGHLDKIAWAAIVVPMATARVQRIRKGDNGSGAAASCVIWIMLSLWEYIGHHVRA